MHILELIVGMALVLAGATGQQYSVRYANQRFGGFNYRVHWRYMLPAQLVTLGGMALLVIAFVALHIEH